MKLSLLILSVLLLFAAAKAHITCPAGTVAKPNPKYPPTNGCGANSVHTFLARTFNPFNTKFLPCCAQHDACEGTCLKTQPNWFDKCNNDLLGCLKLVCAAQKSDQQPDCNRWVGIYDNLARDLGKMYYEEDQDDACVCQ